MTTTLTQKDVRRIRRNASKRVRRPSPVNDAWNKGFVVGFIAAISCAAVAALILYTVAAIL